MLGYRPHPSLGGGSGGPAYDDAELRLRVGDVENEVGQKADLVDLASTDNDVHDLTARTGIVEGRVNGLVASKTILERREHILDCGPASIRKKPSSAILEARTIPRVAGARVAIETTPGSYIDDPDLSDGGFITLRPTVAAIPVTPSNVIPVSGGAGRDWRAQYVLTEAQAAIYQPGDVVHLGVLPATNVTDASCRALGPGMCTAKVGNIVTIRHQAHAQPEYCPAASIRLFRPNLQILTTKPLEIVGSDVVVLDGVGIRSNALTIETASFATYDLIILRSGATMRLPAGDPLVQQMPSVVLFGGRIGIQPERGSRIVGGMLSVGGCSGIAIEMYPGSRIDLYAAYVTTSAIGIRTIAADFRMRRETRESLIAGNQYEGVQAIGGEVYIFGATVIGNAPDLLAVNCGIINATSNGVVVGTISPGANSAGNNNGYIVR